MTSKVLFITNYDKPGIHNIRPEAEMIIGLKRLGVDAEVMTRRRCYWGDRLAEAGVPVHDFVPGKKFSLEAVRYIRRILRDGQHDVLHLFNNPAIVNGVIASIGLPVKVVTYRGQTGNISRWNPVQYVMHLSPRVDRIVCVAEAVRQSLLEAGVSPRKPVTIYKGHDLGWYERSPSMSLETLGIPLGAFVVCCVANYRPRKGADVLIESARWLPADIPIHFLLIGNAIDSKPVRKLVEASPKAANFHLFGHRTDVMSIVASADCTVLPATRREGLPKTVIESMVQEITPIVTATGGSAELVEDGVSGLVIPPGNPQALADAILRLYRNPEETRRMGVRARERIGSRFRLEDSVTAHLRLYEELTGRS